jgi:shikimate kinase / 3-dehydroquinate synthase
MAAPLFLIGFMAAGKTSVGRALAHETGRRFVDLDDVIAMLGEPVASLVARDEAEFRKREERALASEIAAALDAPSEGGRGGDPSGLGPIIATGGGAAAYGQNLERMRRAGCVIALAVDVDEARLRAGDGASRPLLAQPPEKILALAAQRAPVYRRAHAVVDTNGRGVAEVTELVRAAEAAWIAPGDATTVVALGPRSYPGIVKEGAFDASLITQRLGEVSKIAVITDQNVAKHWSKELEAALDLGTGTAVTLEIPPGEAHKTLATYQRLCDALIAHGLDRSSAIVALGGGVVGDIAGFVAATLFRGIQIVQLPTTIVAMTDAAIGGKTAIDTAAGKNLVGAFHQPRLVACNLATLATLPERERRAGFGELWKYALLDGAALWALVDQCATWARIGGEPTLALRDVISRSVAFKAAVVGRDELERTGQRAMLNLGHTVGHAIESETGLLHGEAIGLGLVVACRVSHALGLAPAALAATVSQALQRTGLPHDPDAYLSDRVIARLAVDKKRTGDRVRFIAVREVGACEPVEILLADLGRILGVSSAP